MHRYRYRFKPYMFLYIVLAGVLGYWMIGHAQANDRGLIIDYIIRLSVLQATVFYWILGAIISTMSAAGFLVALISLKQKIYIECTQEHISIPSFFRKKERVIPYNTIQKLRLQKSGRNQVFLVIKSADKNFSINRSFMPSHEDFDEMIAIVAGHTSLTNNIDNSTGKS